MEKKHPVWADILAASSGDIRRLDYVIRYSSVPAIVPESTSSHSFWVTAYSAMIQVAVDASDFQTMSAVLLHACTHDVQDCVTGDVVRTFKYSSDYFKDRVQEAEGKMLERLDPQIGDLTQTIKMLKMAAGDDYVEAIVKAADFMSLFHYMKREAMRGNAEIVPFFLRMQKDLRKEEMSHVDRWISPNSNAYEVSFQGVYASMRTESVKVVDVYFPKFDMSGHTVI